MKRLAADQVRHVQSRLLLMERELFEAKTAAGQLGGDDAVDAAESVGAAMMRIEEAAAEVAGIVGPLWIVQVQDQVAEIVKQALNLDTWEESKGITSLTHIVCPHCHETQRGGRALSGGTRPCETCGKEFFYHRVPTPRGPAWQTWDKDPRTPAEGRV